MKARWVQPDIRDEIVDFIRTMSEKTEIAQLVFVVWVGVSRSKYYDWRSRYGKVNEHNGLVPRDWWLEPWEKEAIINYFTGNPLVGYRRLTYMMIDEDIVAVSPSTVYRILSNAGVLGQRLIKPSSKGKGFVQPLKPHEHWHIDITYLNLGGTFYYMCSVLEGFSRFIVHWEIRESMKEAEVEVILQRAREKFEGQTPRIISDNGPQFVAKDFKEFVRLAGMTHVRTSPFYPQSNGKQERAQGLIKQECIRPKCPQNLEQARKIVGQYIEEYNNKRLHSAIGYVTPRDMLEGRQKEIHQQRDRKLELARIKRKQNRNASKKNDPPVDSN